MKIKIFHIHVCLFAPQNFLNQRFCCVGHKKLCHRKLLQILIFANTLLQSDENLLEENSHFILNRKGPTDYLKNLFPTNNFKKYSTKTNPKKNHSINFGIQNIIIYIIISDCILFILCYVIVLYNYSYYSWLCFVCQNVQYVYFGSSLRTVLPEEIVCNTSFWIT